MADSTPEVNDIECYHPDLIGGITKKSGLVASLYFCLIFLNLFYQIKFYSTLLI